MTHREHCSGYPCFCEALQYGRVLLIALVVIVLEGWLSVVSKSVAVFGDVAHTGFDAIGLLIPIAVVLVVRFGDWWHEDHIRTVGALVQAAGIGVAGLWVMWGALTRFGNPQPIDAILMMLGGVVGLIGNMLMFKQTSTLQHDHATGSALHLHVFADVLVSVAVIVGGALVVMTGITQIEAVVALGIGLYITNVVALRAVMNAVRVYEHFEP